MQSKVVAFSWASASAAVPAPTICTSPDPSSWRMLSRWRSSSSTTSTRRMPWRSLGLEPAERVDQLFALHRLERVADRAELQRLLRVVGHRDDVHRDVARVRVALELIEHAKARMVGQVDVEHDRARVIRRGGRQAVVRRVRQDALKAHLVREIAQDRREPHVVLDDEDRRADRVPGCRDRPRSGITVGRGRGPAAAAGRGGS